MATASKSGRYCLVEDLTQRSVLVIPEGFKQVGSPGRQGVIGFLHRGGSVDIDLQGHLVTGAPFDDTTGIRSSREANIKVANGVVRSPGLRGIGVLMDPYGYIHADTFDNEDFPRARRQDFNLQTRKFDLSDFWDYKPATYYALDRLTVEAGGRGVILSGANNVLRNSTVEVDSAVAVLSYGPNAVIEGNTFIVHRSTDEERRTTSAMLKLRDAHGSVIRNNRFIVKGLFTGKAEAAINLLESTNVLIEGNTVEGAKTLARKDAASTTVEQGNSIK